MSRIQWYGPTLLLLVAVMVVVVAGPKIARSVEWHNTDARIELIRNDLTQSEFLAELSDSFRRVARAVEPSVVHIQILARPSVMMDRSNASPYDAFVQIGSGSGWVYDNQGHIITNHHVVRQGERIRVRFNDGSEYDAQLVNADPATDVAVLKVNADDLHPAAIAHDSAEQGDIVFAFGSPFHFDFSMSQGIVSGKGRTLGWLEGQGGYENYIQTDASINPGNSGGPLTNIRGEVIGMNSAIASRDGNYDGVGFAIPVRMVQQVVDQLIDQGAVRRGYLGVRLPDRDMNDQMARALDFEGRGVLIQDLIPDGPAGQAGLKPGDIITHVEEEPIETIAELRYVVSSYRPGTKIKLGVFRTGDQIVITVELGELPQPMSYLESSPWMGPTPRRPGLRSEDHLTSKPADEADVEPAELEDLLRLGVEGLVTFNEQRQTSSGETIQGVWVGRVRTGSLAQAAGLGGGMVIAQVGPHRVDSVQTLREAIEQYQSGDVLKLRVLRYSTVEGRFVNKFVFLQMP